MNKLAHVMWSSIRLHSTLGIGPLLTKNVAPTAAIHVNVSIFSRTARSMSTAVLSAAPSVQPVPSVVHRASALSAQRADASMVSFRTMSTSASFASPGPQGDDPSKPKDADKSSSRYAWIDEVSYFCIPSQNANDELYSQRVETCICQPLTTITMYTHTGSAAANFESVCKA